MATYRIAVMPGDGIGADVTAEALRVLGVVAKEGGLGLELEEGLIGGAAIDQKGTPLPAQKITRLLEAAGKAAGTTVSVARFVRYERGEGIEKKVDDFAAEVAKMAST